MLLPTYLTKIVKFVATRNVFLKRIGANYQKPDLRLQVAILAAISSIFFFTSTSNLLRLSSSNKAASANPKMSLSLCRKEGRVFKNPVSLQRKLMLGSSICEALSPKYNLFLVSMISFPLSVPLFVKICSDLVSNSSRAAPFKTRPVRFPSEPVSLDSSLSWEISSQLIGYKSQNTGCLQSLSCKLRAVTSDIKSFSKGESHWTLLSVCHTNCIFLYLSNYYSTC